MRNTSDRLTKQRHYPISVIPTFLSSHTQHTTETFIFVLFLLFPVAPLSFIGYQLSRVETKVEIKYPVSQPNKKRTHSYNFTFSVSFLFLLLQFQRRRKLQTNPSFFVVLNNETEGKKKNTTEVPTKQSSNYARSKETSNLGILVLYKHVCYIRGRDRERVRPVAY